MQRRIAGSIEMRILFFSTNFPQPDDLSRNPDNLERCVALGRRHDVRVISPLAWVKLLRRPGNDRADSLRGLTISRPVFCYPPRGLRATHAWCMWQSIRSEVARTLTGFQPDAVLSYWTYPDTAVALEVAKLARVPCVAIVGGSDVLAIDPAAPRSAGRRVQRALREADGIAAVSESIKQRIIALGIDSNRVDVLPAAVDSSVFFPGSKEAARRHLAIPADAHVLLWVGRMVAVKRVDVIVDAITRLPPRFPRLRLYLVGDGPLRRALQHRIAACGLANHVVFIGRVAHRDLPDYYRAADLTVLASEWEGMPNTLLESHACGTPFVASAVGAIPKLAVTNVDRLIERPDPQQLADAIAIGLQRMPESTAMVTVPGGGWNVMADSLVDLLDKARRRKKVSATPAIRAPRQTRLRPNPSRFENAS
jgi:glycosyltransferase involved in cell wall biosynthesis